MVLLALVIRFFCICPRGLLILIVRYSMTAGRDSGSLEQHLRTSACWLNSQRWFYSSTQLQLLSGSNKSGEELTRQREQHHRVVFQPPSSLEGGLEGRRESCYFFNYLIALQRHWCPFSLHMIQLKRLRAHCFSQQVRRFSNISRNNTTGCCYINYCPCSSSYFEYLKLFTVTHHTQASVPQSAQIVPICFEEKDAPQFLAPNVVMFLAPIKFQKSRGLVVDAYIFV